MIENSSLKKVSVIIPMYNSSDTILRALNSVRNQTYLGPIEIIVVNDGSTDSSQTLVEKYCQKYPDLNLLLINQINGGVSNARNSGLSRSSGEFIALLDADDEWLVEKLEIQVNCLVSNYEIDFLGCSRNDEILSILNTKITSMYKVSPKDLLIKMFPQTSTAIFKRQLFELEGGYNTSMTHGEDGELWLRYCAKSNFFYSPDSLVITGGGKPNFGYSGLSANLNKMFKGNLQILKLAKKLKVINVIEYCSFLVFYYLKYFRRILISKAR